MDHGHQLLTNWDDPSSILGDVDPGSPSRPNELPSGKNRESVLHGSSYKMELKPS